MLDLNDIHLRFARTRRCWPSPTRTSIVYAAEVLQRVAHVHDAGGSTQFSALARGSRRSTLCFESVREHVGRRRGFGSVHLRSGHPREGSRRQQPAHMFKEATPPAATTSRWPPLFLDRTGSRVWGQGTIILADTRGYHKGGWRTRGPHHVYVHVHLVHSLARTV